MDFYTLFDQVLDLLRRRGRVSYRALTLQFNLDDEHLEALKEELIEVQQLATDQDGKMLVWAGAAPAPSERVPPSLQPTPQSDLQAGRAISSDPPPAARRTADAERRQLTVMFCDLVDSTPLASQLDPEDWREVLRAYHAACAALIQRFAGHIAQYLGDGLLVYFGYPQAHEDDAQRAVHAALAIVEAMGELNVRLAHERGIQLAVRLGVHTGLVVVGEIGGGTRQEQLALGDTPNLAARLQGLAAPNTVVLSPVTARLIHGYFVCQDLGAHALKGVAIPVSVFQVLRASAAQSRLDVVGATGFTPLVGRDAEVALLLERWAQSRDGRGQVVLLRGEAGIGKSRLVEMLREHTLHEGAMRMALRCSPYHQNSALYPLLDHLAGPAVAA